MSYLRSSAKKTWASISMRCLQIGARWKLLFGCKGHGIQKLGGAYWMTKAINDLVLSDPVPLGKQHHTLVPLDSVDEIYLPLSAFDYSKAAKNGCAGCPNIFTILFCSSFSFVCLLLLVCFNFVCLPCRFSNKCANRSSFLRVLEIWLQAKHWQCRSAISTG